jgi:hypothetical protein
MTIRLHADNMRYVNKWVDHEIILYWYSLNSFVYAPCIFDSLVNVLKFKERYANTFVH